MGWTTAVGSPSVAAGVETASKPQRHWRRCRFALPFPDAWPEKVKGEEGGEEREREKRTLIWKELPPTRLVTFFEL